MIFFLTAIAMLLMSDLLLRFSIQRAAVWLLDRYYSDFPVYNPALHNLPKSILSKKMTGFKVYSLDGKYGLSFCSVCSSTTMSF